MCFCSSHDIRHLYVYSFQGCVYALSMFVFKFTNIMFRYAYALEHYFMPINFDTNFSRYIQLTFWLFSFFGQHLIGWLCFYIITLWFNSGTTWFKLNVQIGNINSIGYICYIVITLCDLFCFDKDRPFGSLDGAMPRFCYMIHVTQSIVRRRIYSVMIQSLRNSWIFFGNPLMWR